MDIETMKKIVYPIAIEYPIKKITLFGSRADNTNREDSDVDLIIEFTEPVSLLTLSKIRIHLEEVFGLSVDVVHEPLQGNELIEINKEVELYVA